MSTNLGVKGQAISFVDEDFKANVRINLQIDHCNQHQQTEVQGETKALPNKLFPWSEPAALMTAVQHRPTDHARLS